MSLHSKEQPPPVQCDAVAEIKRVAFYEIVFDRELKSTGRNIISNKTQWEYTASFQNSIKMPHNAP